MRKKIQENLERNSRIAFDVTDFWLSFHDTQQLGRLGVIRVRVRRPFKYFLYCGLGILRNRIVFVMRVMVL